MFSFMRGEKPTYTMLKVRIKPEMERKRERGDYILVIKLVCVH